MSFAIQPDGAVTDVRVISGHPMLVEDAGNKLKRWKFNSVTFNGEPVTASVTMAVYYSGTD